jgi:uncharacterized protein DUF6348
MFSWFKKSPRPPKPASSNPGRGHTVRVAFANAQRSWEEEDDLAVSLAATLNALGHKALVKGDWVELEGGFSFLPQVVAVTPMDDSGVKTTTTIQVSHPDLVPAGVFEYQHSTGANVRESFSQGFKSWSELDLPVFLDAQREKAKSCMYMEMKQGQEATSVLAADRRIVLGPPLQMVQKTNPIPGEHVFCPCCLFTSSFRAFDSILKGREFHGIRLFVSRDAEGHIQADCRVNGVDWPAGAAELVKYARDWPDRGLEYRKQYVCVQTRPASS